MREWLSSSVMFTTQSGKAPRKDRMLPMGSATGAVNVPLVSVRGAGMVSCDSVVDVVNINRPSRLLSST